MFRYYQVSKKSDWVPISDSIDVEQRALSLGAKKLTILALSDIIDDSVDKESVSYRGPLYFDIDNDSDPAAACQSAQELVKKLKGAGVHQDDVCVYISGKKGYHVIISEKVFSPGRAIQKLPGIYLELALSLYVPNLDMGVYSAGRGRVWSIANVQREDGAYRVRISHSDLEQMTPDRYKFLASQPSTQTFPPAPGNKAPELETLFELAKKRAKSRVRKVATIQDDALAQFVDQPPLCIDEIAKGAVCKGKNFNEVALQVAIFLSRSGTGNAGRSAIVNRVSDNLTSSSYNTPISRREHLTGLIHYASARSELKFSCGATRGLLKGRPCDGCPINEKTSADDSPEALGIERKPSGYWGTGGEVDRRLTNFLLEPISVFLEESQHGDITRRVSTKFEVVRNGVSVGTFMLDETGWESKSKFITQIAGIDNCIFTGGDNDIQLLKCAIMQEEDGTMGEIVRVYSAGVHHHKIGNKKVRVYVEPGMSVNQMKVSDTHYLSGIVAAPPRIKEAKKLVAKDEAVNKTLENLFKVNSDFCVAQLIGWHAACHFKTHIMDHFRQFPVLSVWGNASSGKSMTTTLMAYLNGCDYSGESTALNMPSTTQWALINYCSGTTTVPRILEEYNKARISRGMYDFSGDIIKAAWNGLSVPRGTIAKTSASGSGKTGAHVVEIPISAPLIVVSEQAPTVPALVQRSVTVMLNSANKNVGAYKYADRHHKELMPVARELVVKALQTTPEKVARMIEEEEGNLPDAITDRPKFSYQVVGAGLRLMEEVLTTAKLPIASRLDELRQGMYGELTTYAHEIEKTKRWSEVDVMLESLGVMIALSESGDESTLMGGIHYVLTDDSLYLDLTLAHSMLQKFCRSVGQKVVIESISQFATLLKMERYFVTDSIVVQGARSRRPMVQLDLKKMEEKGHMRSSFVTG